MALHPGDVAPNLTLPDQGNQARALADCWHEQPTMLVFLRHFGWPHCRAQAVQLCRDKQRYDAANVQIVLVGLGSPEKATQFRKDLDLPFTVLCDPDKTTYQAFGLTRRMRFASEARLQGVVQVIADVARYGGALTEQDMLQLGGVFVIDRSGHVRYAYTAMRAADRPALEDVLAAGPFS